MVNTEIEYISIQTANITTDLSIAPTVAQLHVG